MTVEIVESYLPASNANRRGAVEEYGQRLDALGLVFHTTANPGSNAMDHKRWLLGGDVGCSFHCCSDWDRVMAFLPWRPGEAIPGGHCLPSGNRRFLGWEMCETADPERFARSWTLAVDGVSTVLRVYGQGVDWLLTHGQVTRWWPEDHGDHTDPAPYFTKWGRTWLEFLCQVDQALRKPQNPVPPEDWKTAVLERAHKAGVLSDPHQPGESVEIEELAAVGLRLHDRLADVERRLAPQTPPGGGGV